jgi:hypothetical protein
MHLIGDHHGCPGVLALLLEGGYECELDVVAFDPKEKHLVHIEPSMVGGSRRTL